LRLLILNQYALPRGAAGITRHGDLGARLAARGHEVRILASRFNYLSRLARSVSESPDEEVLSGVSFKWLDTGTYTGNDRKRVRSMAAYVLRSVSVGMRQTSRPNVVVASTPHLFTGIAGVLIAWRHRAPFVLEVRDLWPSILVDLGAVRRGSVTHRLLELLERWLYRRATLVIFVPPDGQRRLVELGLDDVESVHIPNAADLQGGSDPVPPSLQACMDELRGRHVLIYAGAHGVANDLGTIIDALDELKSRSPGVYAKTGVLFIGDGGEKRALSERVAASGHQGIRMHPPIPRAALGSAFQAADGLIVSVAAATAHSYGLSPNKLFDYMAAARPVLISSHVPTIVDEAMAGFRYEPGDARALAGCIEALLDAGAPERAAMGARGRALVERDYDLGTVATRLERALADVAR